MDVTCIQLSKPIHLKFWGPEKEILHKKTWRPKQVLDGGAQIQRPYDENVSDTEDFDEIRPWRHVKSI